MKDRIDSFIERADVLRQEITQAIVNLLQEYHLTELKLSKYPEKQPRVIWFDDRSYGYDSRVTKVALYGNGISVEVYDEDCCCDKTLYSDNSDLACTNIDWLCKILDCANFSLSLPKSKGITTIYGYKITWFYKEQGLGTLPEENIEDITNLLKEGITEGTIIYYNEYDVEFDGIWKIVQE